MRCVFQASNGIEAHMMKSYLEQHDIASEVFGEHLQGGVGDLQTMGLVRLMVAGDDYERAREIVTQWESTNHVDEPSLSHVKGYASFWSGVGWFILGAVVFGVVTQVNVDSEGVDYDGDGVLDEQWEYVNNLVRTVKIDQNRDGNNDAIYEYDFRGRLTSAKFDHGFDSHFEVTCDYEYGNVVECRVDENGDGFFEISEEYQHGILAKVTMYDPKSTKLRKKQYFEAGRMVKAEVDLDGDGVLETLHEYDQFEEIIGQ